MFWAGPLTFPMPRRTRWCCRTPLRSRRRVRSEATSASPKRSRVLAAKVIAAALAGDGTAAEAIAALADRLNAARSLRDLGLRADEINRAVELVDATLSQLPEPVSRADTEALIRAAYEGTTPMAQVSAR